MRNKSQNVPTRFNSIEQYHASFPVATRNILDKLRSTIQKIVPQAEETISYNIPTFRLNKNLVHYAAYSRHVGFYPTSRPLLVFADALQGYTTSKGAVQFPLDQTIPWTLIRKIVQYRVNEDAKEVKGKKTAFYYKNGSLQAKGHMLGGQQHGYWEWFRRDGTIMRSGSMFYGQPIGDWCTYDTKGKLIKVRFRK